MAAFRQLTRIDGANVVINADQVRWLLARSEHSTQVLFEQGHSIDVKGVLWDVSKHLQEGHSAIPAPGADLPNEGEFL